MVPKLHNDSRQPNDDGAKSDDSDFYYDETTGFGSSSHIYGGIIYSDSNGMSSIDGDIYSSSPITQNLASLHSYVPDIEQLATPTLGGQVDNPGQTSYLVDQSSHVTSDIVDSHNYYHNMSNFNNSMQPGDDGQYWSHAHHPHDVTGMTSTAATSSQHGMFISHYQQPSTTLHHHMMAPTDAPANQDQFSYHTSSSVTSSQQPILATPMTSGQQAQPQRRNNKKQQNNTPKKPKGTPGRKVKVPDYELSPAEAKKRHLRRERNKVAAAKCRNRRRELTDRLQGETDELQKQYHQLTHEEQQLRQTKQQLEYILKTHAMEANRCKRANNTAGPATSAASGGNYFNVNSISSVATNDDNNPITSYPVEMASQFPLTSVQGCSVTSQMETIGDHSDKPAITTPVCSLVTPSHLSNQIFTFPSGVTSSTTTSSALADDIVSSSSVYNYATFGSSNQHQVATTSCSLEHRQQRSASSSGESLDSSNHSPDLMVL